MTTSPARHPALRRCLDWGGQELDRVCAGPQGLPGQSLRPLPSGARLFDALALARGDGRLDRLLRSLARVELLILDDWGLSPLTAEQRRDLLEILEDRHDRGSTMVTSQLPVEHWHEIIGDPTIADAILDRLVHNAHRLILNGESLRKTAAKRQKLDAEPVE